MMKAGNSSRNASWSDIQSIHSIYSIDRRPDSSDSFEGPDSDSIEHLTVNSDTANESHSY